MTAALGPEVPPGVHHGDVGGRRGREQRPEPFGRPGVGVALVGGRRIGQLIGQGGERQRVARPDRVSPAQHLVRSLRVDPGQPGRAGVVRDDDRVAVGVGDQVDDLGERWITEHVDRGVAHDLNGTRGAHGYDPKWCRRQRRATALPARHETTPERVRSGVVSMRPATYRTESDCRTRRAESALRCRRRTTASCRRYARRAWSALTRSRSRAISSYISCCITSVLLEIVVVVVTLMRQRPRLTCGGAHADACAPR